MDAVSSGSPDWSIRFLVRTIKILSTLGVTAVGTLALVLYFAQSSLIYPSSFPAGSRTEVQTPDRYDIPFEDVTLDTPDDEKIKLFVMKQGGAAAQEDLSVRGNTVIMCCANAGNMGHRLPIASAFYKILQYNVILFSYRGYGLSTGTPSERGLKIDAETVLAHVQSDPVLKHTNIVLYGQSLGGAVAIYLAEKHEHEVAGMILENTFRSIPLLVPSVLPLARYFTFLCHQIWPSEATLAKITSIPVLFLSGDKDEIVPQTHMRSLYESCKSPHKIWRQFANGTHNDTYAKDGYWTAIIDFTTDFIDKKKQ
ncbi:Alpha/Beta hydrolase protein [Limtongia smithiae]|uniref:Alpha/Beta hydrolase protein n=1 Tax=Limtongia smithiae TaxID=1125753 RepID=UPI0034CD87DA